MLLWYVAESDPFSLDAPSPFVSCSKVAIWRSGVNPRSFLSFGSAPTRIRFRITHWLLFRAALPIGVCPGQWLTA